MLESISKRMFYLLITDIIKQPEMIKDPVPLYAYPHNMMPVNERKKVFQELQRDNRQYIYQLSE